MFFDDASTCRLQVFNFTMYFGGATHSKPHHSPFPSFHPSVIISPCRRIQYQNRKIFSNWKCLDNLLLNSSFWHWYHFISFPGRRSGHFPNMGSPKSTDVPWCWPLAKLLASRMWCEGCSKKDGKGSAGWRGRQGAVPVAATLRYHAGEPSCRSARLSMFCPGMLASPSVGPSVGYTQINDGAYNRWRSTRLE